MIGSRLVKTTLLISFMITAILIITACQKNLFALTSPVISDVSTYVGGYQEISSKVIVESSSPMIDGYGIDNSLDGNLYDDYSAATLTPLPQSLSLGLNPPAQIDAIEMVWLSVEDYSSRYAIKLYGTNGDLSKTFQIDDQKGIDHLIQVNSTEPVEKIQFNFEAFSGQQRLLLKQILLFHLERVDRKQVPDIPVKYLTCLNDASLARIRANPTAIDQVYQNCRPEFTALLKEKFPQVTEQLQLLMFNSVVATQIAPYGASNAPIDLEALLHSPYMQCAQYVSLNYLLYNKSMASDSRSLDIAFVGWQGGIITAHTQIFVTDQTNRQAFLLDPTIGLIARANFDQVASGQSVSPDDIILYGSPNQSMEFTKLVIEALIKGLYKPSDLYFYTDSFTAYTQTLSDNFIFTPGFVKKQNSILAP